VFARFADKARNAVVFAQEDARSLGHNYIGTEHLLLGLLRVEEGVAARVLTSLGVTHDGIRDQVARIVGTGDSDRGEGQIPFTPRAKRVLELALREALSIGHDYIGTEHILLGLARENDGVAARILLDFDVSAERIYDEVYSLLGRPRPQPQSRFRRPRGIPTPHAAQVRMQPALPWEYRVEKRAATDEELAEWLNALGAEGWELTALTPSGDEMRLIFKRPCRPAREQRSA
jgi:ATP-dependent Clp protease ATP-binding subunit ClpA